MNIPQHYSHTFIQEFIEMYRSFPCLWKVGSKDYSNRQLRCKAYDKLADKLKEVEPLADRDMVCRKINSLRSAFRREFRKVSNSQQSGGTYRPCLWYYELLLFTMGQDAPAKEDSSFGAHSGEENSNEFEVKHEYEEFEETERTLNPAVPEVFSHEPMIDFETLPRNAKRKTNFDQERTQEAVLEYACSQLTKECDQFDNFGKIVAEKLRCSMSNEQKLYAQKLIWEVMFCGELGELSLQTTRSIQNILSGSGLNCSSPQTNSIEPH